MSKFTIIYDPNDFCPHPSEEMMEATIVVRGVPTPLQRNQYKYEGHEFIGWKAYRLSDKKTCYVSVKSKERRYFLENKQPDGWVPYIYKDGCKVSRLSSVDADVIIMYAQWQDSKVCSETDVQRKRKLIEERILNRPIVLYGDSKNCEKFYKKYANRLNIRCILLEEESQSLVSNINVEVHQFKKNLLKSDDYVIICTPIKIRLDGAYRTARKNLVQSKRKIMEDFVRQDVAEVILDNKKLWLWFGFCQADTLRKDIFQKLTTVKNQYVLAAFRYGLDTLKKSYKYEDCIEMLKICDCITYIPLVFAEGKIDFDLFGCLPKEAKKIALPRIPFRGYYPYRESDLEAFHAFSVDGKLHWPFGYSEKIIDDLILEGKSDDDIYAELMRDDLIDEKEIKKNLKLAYKFIQISENSADIKMLDFIKENFPKRLLYRDGLHYQNFMYFEMARRISKFMGIDCEDEIDKLEDSINQNQVQFIDYTEVPILPCVAKVLGLDFVTDDTLWRVRFTEKGAWRGTGVTIKMMTRKEWIYAYVRYTKACISLKEFWN